MRVDPAPLRGTVDPVISSKSQAHRALICAAMADGTTVLEGVVPSEDVDATCGCLTAAGAEIRREGGTLRVTGGPAPEGPVYMDCGESGSTLRFLLPMTAARGISAALTGRGKLASRPLSPLYEEMTAHGAALSPQGAFPLTVAGRLTSGIYTLAGNVSSQFISGLLMALPLLPGDSEVRITGPLESAPYVDMTRQMLETFGVTAEKTDAGFRVPGGQVFRSPGRLRVEGDWSGAAFWLAAGALSEEGVACGGLRTDSAQGDRAIVDLLRRFGAEVSGDAGRVRVRRGALRGQRLDLGDIPDLAPILAVTAAYAEGDTVMTRIGRLRLKESDRVASVLAMIHSLGGAAETAGDALVIHGRGGLRGGEVDAFHDHRIAMAAAIAGTRTREPVTIIGAEAVSKSYPGFFEVFESLGGRKEQVG